MFIYTLLLEQELLGNSFLRILQKHLVFVSYTSLDISEPIQYFFQRIYYDFESKIWWKLLLEVGFSSDCLNLLSIFHEMQCLMKCVGQKQNWNISNILSRLEDYHRIYQKYREHLCENMHSLRIFRNPSLISNVSCKCLAGKF